VFTASRPRRVWIAWTALVVGALGSTAAWPASKTTRATGFQRGDAPGRFAQILRVIRDSNAPELIGTRVWSSLVAQHREAVVSCTTHGAFAAAVNRLIDDSSVSHFHYYTDDDWQYWHLQSTFGDEGARTELEHVGIIPDEIDNRWFARGILEGSPAAGLDIRVGDEILTVDGLPYSPVASFRHRAGAPVTIRLDRRPGQTHEVEAIPVKESLYKAMQRAIIESISTVEHEGFRFAYLHGWTLLGQGREYDQLADLQGRVDGLLLDYRDGLGGTWHAAQRFLVGDDDDLAGDVPPRWIKPVVILTGEGTRSAKEIVVHKVKKARRAPLVGDSTPGHVVSVGALRQIGDDGLLMLPGQRFALEGKPTEPDYAVQRDIRHCAGADPQMDFAKKLLARMAREQRQLAKSQPAAARNGAN